MTYFGVEKNEMNPFGAENRGFGSDLVPIPNDVGNSEREGVEDIKWIQ